jgi:nitrate/nitrite-specific signal transduction histidine kinase
VQDKKTRDPGLGLVAMKERAELLRGRFSVEKATGGGTVVKLHLPLPQEEGQAYLTQQRQEAQTASHD